MACVVALQGFHYRDAVGVAYASPGEMLPEFPDELVEGYVSIGRVREIKAVAPASPVNALVQALDDNVVSSPLDHDGDGLPGGSLPASERGLDDLWAEAESLGLKVDRRKTGAAAAERLKTLIAKARTA